MPHQVTSQGVASHHIRSKLKGYTHIYISCIVMCIYIYIYIHIHIYTHIYIYIERERYIDIVLLLLLLLIIIIMIILTIIIHSNNNTQYYDKRGKSITKGVWSPIGDLLVTNSAKGGSPIGDHRPIPLSALSVPTGLIASRH